MYMGNVYGVSLSTDTIVFQLSVGNLYLNITINTKVHSIIQSVCPADQYEKVGQK